jgi:hypothetical protein
MCIIVTLAIFLGRLGMMSHRLYDVMNMSQPYILNFSLSYKQYLASEDLLV